MPCKKLAESRVLRARMTSWHFVARNNSRRTQFQYTLTVLKTGFFAVGLAVVAAGQTVQQQQSNTRASWPCGARIDPGYFHLAEGTGGQLLLLARSEIMSSADLSTAFDNHAETIFRLGGTLTPGLHDFHVPIDGSVETAMFSMSVQCLQTAEVLRPSGAAAAGDDVTDLSHFVAARMVVVSKPEAGVWTVRVSGSGLAGVVVKARSVVHIASVEFAPAGTRDFRSLPTAGVENVVRIRTRGRVVRPEAALVDAASRQIAALPLSGDEAGGVYQSRFTPGVDGFRVMITGTGEDGTALQRVYAPLFTAR